MGKVTSGGLRWWGGVGGRGEERDTVGGTVTNPSVAYVIKTEWSYCVLKASELQHHVSLYARTLPRLTQSTLCIYTL